MSAAAAPSTAPAVLAPPPAEPPPAAPARPPLRYFQRIPTAQIRSVLAWSEGQAPTAERLDLQAKMRHELALRDAEAVAHA